MPRAKTRPIERIPKLSYYLTPPIKKPGTQTCVSDDQADRRGKAGLPSNGAGCQCTESQTRAYEVKWTAS